ncbi:ribonuclease P protein component [Mobiluncus curtisii]|uniref:ribonuclease P protein component n=1 Tax=Mobiluncus curtisii TaxID=2051 RepID=UPI0014701CA9|nr:ribonuclease P protein component [Mobiluncus curtisii]NMW46393.1 ribonuclease P protein component [Mobiluncus curtisii]
MLAKANRLTRAQDFRQAMREGRHAHCHNMVFHQYLGNGSEPARIGFVVAKRFVKHATGRNLVKRRLRHLLRDRITEFPAGSLNVFYAKAGIAEVDYPQLENQIQILLRKMAHKQHGDRDFVSPSRSC